MQLSKYQSLDKRYICICIEINLCAQVKCKVIPKILVISSCIGVRKANSNR